MEENGDHEEGQDAGNSNLQSTFDSRASFDVNEPVGSASISPAGRDVALASRLGLHIIDLDNPYSPPRYLPHRTPWEVADVQWSPFASRDYWIASTSNQKALIWNVAAPAAQAVEHVLQAHTRALTDINFSAHDPDMLATCAVDSFIHCWDLRTPARPVISFADWYAGATQVKWNRQDSHILASSHDEKFHIWDTRTDSHPLRTIDAHLTKIYGIDWNRVEASHLLTCSLDRTIKLWDYTADEDNMLMRTIHTPYPVWRARHTPFGYGVLAMPQRGDNELHLYDRRLHEGEPQDAPVEPVHTFEGHTDQVKEFLWRVRHGEDNGMDNRSFQLVSWAADKQLRLHPMSEEVLDKIGYHQGQSLHAQQRFSRKGATYRSYNNPDKPVNASAAPLLQLADSNRRRSAISDALNASSRTLPVPDSMASIRVHRGVEGGMRVSSSDQKQANPISWMRGVKISTKDDTSSPRDSTSITTASQILPWDSPESLAEEISSAGDRYKNVTFEDVSVPARTIAVSANGPFGLDRASVYVQMTIFFPPGYPKEDVPDFIIEKTSSISEGAFQRMCLEIKVLCEEYKQEQQGCIAAVFRYVTGDQTLEQSLAWLKTINQLRHDELDIPSSEESSSDEEDNVIGQMAGLRSRQIGSSAGDLLQKNANVPIPKHCAALFVPSGKLVCFFPSPEPASSLLGSVSQLSRDAKSQDLFEGFGNLQHALNKHAGDVKPILNETDSQSSEESFSSGSSSFGSSEGAGDVVPFSSFTLWSAGVVPRPSRSIDRSRDRSTGQSQQQSYAMIDPRKPRMHVSVYSIEEDDSGYPKRSLAEAYIIVGQGDVVCAHNAEVARDRGYPELGDVWDLVRLILCDEVPLHITPELLHNEPISVVAKRGIVHIKRKDSGLDFGFDHPTAVREPKLKAHVKWGQHPLGSEYLVQAIFEHFLNVGDVQMLAMLSCIFFEPAPSPSDAKAVLYRNDERLSSNRNVPAFSLPYWPNTQLAKSLEVAKPPPPAAAPLRSSMKPLPSGTGSSVGSDHTYLAPTGSATSMPTIVAEMEDGTKTRAVPILLPRGGALESAKGFSASPEHVLRRSSSIVGNAFNKVAFLLSHSPPLQRKEAAGAATAELSTSAPSASIPIPKSRVKGEAGSVRFSEPAVDPRSASTAGHDDAGDTNDEPRSKNLRIRLKNQDQFDDEACFPNAFVPPQNAWQHKHWREEYAGHLDAWNLTERYLELLSFNHFEPLFKVSEDATPTHGRSQEVAPAHIGLEISLLCTRCRKAVPSTVTSRSGSRRCLGCEKVSANVCCSICGELVQGLHKTCVDCGHASHQHCFEMWTADEVGTQFEDDCEVGCGCHCLENCSLDKQFWTVIDNAAHEDTAASRRPSTVKEPEMVTSSSQISPTKSGVDRYGTARTRKSLLSYSMSGWREPSHVGGS